MTAVPPPAYPPPPQRARTGGGVAIAGLCIGILALVTAVDGRSGAAAGLFTAVGLALSIAGVALAAGRGGSVATGVVGIVSSALALVVCLVSLASITSPVSASLPAPVYRAPSIVAPSAPTVPAAVPSVVPDTVEVAPPAPATIAAPPSRLFTASGSGDDVLTIQKSPGPAVVTFRCPKCASNTVLESDGKESLLVNTIGSYSGKRWIDADSTSTTSRLTITATGAWSISVGGLDQATAVTGPVRGHGDEVLLMNTPASVAAITNRGSGNFVVETVSAQGESDLAVNEIGSYSGRVPFSAPAIVQVTSDGAWSLTPQ